MNIFACDLHVTGVRSEPGPFTARAGERRSVAAEHHAHMQLIAFPFQVFKKLLYAFHLAFSVPDHLLDRLGQVFVREGEIDPAPFHEEQHLLLPPIAAGFAPGFNCALSERLAVVGNDEVGVVPENVAKPFACRTGAERMVEGKEHWTNRLECSPALLAAKVCAVDVGTLLDDLHAT